MKYEGYEIIQIDNGSWRIETEMVRAFLFVGTARALLVDSTNVPGKLDAVVRQLTDKPVCLVNTHADADHTGCNDRFSEAWMHPAEFAYYARTARPGYAAPRPLQDGEYIDLGGRGFEVILIPGHTFGSIALLDRNARILISGDSISATPVFLFGDMRNLDAFIVSLQRLQARCAEYDQIYPSHGPCPLEQIQVERQLRCAEKLKRGELAPEEPPFPIPAKMYRFDGAGFFYSFDNH